MSDNRGVIKGRPRLVHSSILDPARVPERQPKENKPCGVVPAEDLTGRLIIQKNLRHRSRQHLWPQKKYSAALLVFPSCLRGFLLPFARLSRLSNLSPKYSRSRKGSKILKTTKGISVRKIQGEDSPGKKQSSFFMGLSIPAKVERIKGTRAKKTLEGTRDTYWSHRPQGPHAFQISFDQKP